MRPSEWLNEWHRWHDWNPPAVLIQVTRSYWGGEAVTVFPWEIPAANTSGLYWRLTGIAKQQIEGI